MSLSSVPYNWYNVINVIKKIYSMLKYKDSKCDLYTMDYISISPIHCSKGNLKYFPRCTKFPGKQANGYMFKKKCSSIEQQYKKFGDGLNKKRGKNKYTCPMFDKEFLASSK